MKVVSRLPEPTWRDGYREGLTDVVVVLGEGLKDMRLKAALLQDDEVVRVIHQGDGTTVELRHIVPATKVRLLHDVTATKEEWKARRGE